MRLQDIATWATVPPTGIGGSFWVIVKVTTDDGIEGVSGRRKDRSNNASIPMVAGVSVRSLWGSMSVREQPSRGRGDAISSRQT